MVRDDLITWNPLLHEPHCPSLQTHLPAFLHLTLCPCDTNLPHTYLHFFQKHAHHPASPQWPLSKLSSGIIAPVPPGRRYPLLCAILRGLLSCLAFRLCPLPRKLAGSYLTVECGTHVTAWGPALGHSNSGAMGNVPLPSFIALAMILKLY